VKLSEFRLALDTHFAPAVASALMSDLVLPALGSRTPAQSLAEGRDPQLVWDALCAEMRLSEDARFPHRADRGHAGR